MLRRQLKLLDKNFGLKLIKKKGKISIWYLKFTNIEKSNQIAQFATVLISSETYVSHNINNIDLIVTLN